MSLHNRGVLHLVLTAQEKFRYAIPELESIGKILNVDLHDKWFQNDVHTHVASSPILVLHSVSDHFMKNVVSRSVLSKSTFELWGFGRNLLELKESILQFPIELKEMHYDITKTFAVRVKGLGKKLSTSQQIEKIDSLESVLPFQGKVDLVKPDAEFYIIEDYTNRCEGQPPRIPSALYFGRLLCHGQRSMIERYSLKTRKFIGNTSMDPMLGMVMANLGCVAPNYLVCDPFVGTGSLLIAAAHFGSYVIGADINYNILHAKGKSSRRGAGWRQKDETIHDSLVSYGMGDQYIDVLLCDAANHAWHLSGNIMFDAIITDPPYGIREACQRLGSKRGENVVVPELLEGQIHFPEQKAYHLDDVFKDLLTFAAETLMQGGRLVYWLPVHRTDYSVDVIPAHPALRLLYNCEQILNGHSSRRLIVMEKTSFTSQSDATKREEGTATIKSDIYSGHNAFRNKYFKS